VIGEAELSRHCDVFAKKVGQQAYGHIRVVGEYVFYIENLVGMRLVGAL
jgi:hypothetical protein